MEKKKVGPGVYVQVPIESHADDANYQQAYNAYITSNIRKFVAHVGL